MNPLSLYSFFVLPAPSFPPPHPSSTSLAPDLAHSFHSPSSHPSPAHRKLRRTVFLSFPPCACLPCRPCVENPHHFPPLPIPPPSPDPPGGRHSTSIPPPVIFASTAMCASSLGRTRHLTTHTHTYSKPPGLVTPPPPATAKTRPERPPDPRPPSTRPSRPSLPTTSPMHEERRKARLCPIHLLPQALPLPFSSCCTNSFDSPPARFSSSSQEQ